MAITPDQIMMLAQLADWAGTQMAPDNPFAGYAQQYVGARNYAKQLQTPGAPGAPGATPGAAPIAPTAEPSALAPPNPFSPEAIPPTAGPGAGYKFDQMPQAKEPDLLSQAMEPGVRALFDEDNNLTLTRKVPAQQHPGAPAKKEAPPQNMSNLAANPFWYRG